MPCEGVTVSTRAVAVTEDRVQMSALETSHADKYLKSISPVGCLCIALWPAP